MHRTVEEAKIFEKELERRGFHKFYYELNHSDCGYQKCYCEGKAKLFFLDCYKYDFTKYGADLGIGFQWEAQLYRKGDHAALNVSCAEGPADSGDWTLEEVEKFIFSMFDRGELEPYED